MLVTIWIGVLYIIRIKHPKKGTPLQNFENRLRQLKRKSIDDSINRLFFDTSIIKDLRTSDQINQPKFSMMKYCKHCSLFLHVQSEGNNNYQYFTNVVINDHRKYKHFFNNIYDFQLLAWLERNQITSFQECPFSGDMKLKHPLCFRSNIGKPSSLLLNRLFDIRNIDAGGDCGVLCLLYAFLSTSTNIQNEISENIDIYMRNHWLTNYVEVEDIQIFTMTGIRHALLYAKLDNLKDYPILESINEDSFHQNSDGEQNEIYGYLIDHFDNLMQAKKANDKAMIIDLFQEMKKFFLEIRQLLIRTTYIG